MGLYFSKVCISLKVLQIPKGLMPTWRRRPGTVSKASVQPRLVARLLLEEKEVGWKAREG